MRKYLVISNDLINIDKNQISTDNNDTINIISAIQKKFEIYLYSRPSKLKNIFHISTDKKINRINLFDLFNFSKIDILMISITPRNFIFLLIARMVLKNLKGYVLLRSNGHKEYQSKFGKIGFFLYDLMFNYITKKLKIISVSKNIIKKKNVKYLFPSELDNDWFKKIKKINNKIPRLLYFGRFRKEKGIYSLLTLAENLYFKFYLTMAGDTKIIPTKNDNIKILGKISNKKKIISLYDNHNMLILPSYTEGSPKVIIESLARMRPVIVFNEIKHVKSNFYGVYVCKRNVNSLEKTIKYIIKNYSKVQISMKKNDLYTKKKFQSNLLNILNE